MSKSEKLKFDRDSKFQSQYFIVTKDIMGNDYEKRGIGSISYESNGKILVANDGFEYSFQGVDELEVVISPMDSFFSKVKFKIKKIDDTTKTLPTVFYGVRGTNIFINYDNEISGAEDLPDDGE